MYGPSVVEQKLRDMIWDTAVGTHQKQRCIRAPQTQADLDFCDGSPGVSR